MWGRGAEAVGVLERARADGLDVAADQYPYTAAATTLATILPPALLGLGVDACVAALADLEVRALVKAEIDRGTSGWEDIARDPGWGVHPDLVRREPSGLVRADARPSSATSSGSIPPTSPSRRSWTTASTSRS